MEEDQPDERKQQQRAEYLPARETNHVDDDDKASLTFIRLRCETHSMLNAVRL